MTTKPAPFVPNRAGTVIERRGAWPTTPFLGAGWSGRWSGHLSCVGGATVESGLEVVVVGGATLRFTQPAWNGQPFIPDLVSSADAPAVAAGKGTYLGAAAEAMAVLAGDNLVIGRHVQVPVQRFEGHVSDPTPAVECVAQLTRNL